MTSASISEKPTSSKPIVVDSVSKVGASVSTLTDDNFSPMNPVTLLIQHIEAINQSTQIVVVVVVVSSMIKKPKMQEA